MNRLRAASALDRDYQRDRLRLRRFIEVYRLFDPIVLNDEVLRLQVIYRVSRLIPHQNRNEDVGGLCMKCGFLRERNSRDKAGQNHQ